MVALSMLGQPSRINWNSLLISCRILGLFDEYFVLRLVVHLQILGELYSLQDMFFIQLKLVLNVLFRDNCAHL